MWHPEPGWQPLPGGTGPSTAGIWAATVGGRDVVVKRLVPPVDDDPDQASPTGYAYWRRAADVAMDGLLGTTEGLREAPVVDVRVDAEGITLTHARVRAHDNPGLFLARGLGRFAAEPVPERTWLARDQLRARLRRTARRGGWRSLARTTAADVADHLWQRREHHLRSLEAMPQVLQHGDPTPANLPGRAGEQVIALDWGSLGTGALGADLGLLALATREDLEPLAEAYVTGHGAGERGPVLRAARISAVYTALSRADWALSRVSGGEGALAGKFAHPAVAPYLRALQRQAPHVEALL